MKRFVYRLEPVLRQREWALRDAQAALAEANEQVAQQEREVAAVLDRYKGALDDWTALVGAGRECGVDVYARQAAYAADVATRLADDRAALAERVTVRDATAALLAARRREVDAADDHRARSHARFRQVIAVKEFADADDRWIDPSRKEER
ncbi:hypothetical protein [Massilia luteola]|uniref:hypothetical protein n=1 Tax=Massilia luteola TaxID=3081751 RepID=UPI002ACBE059|nr:hypothetical protein [Massilia sp. Gc5]